MATRELIPVTGDQVVDGQPAGEVKTRRPYRKTVYPEVGLHKGVMETLGIPVDENGDSHFAERWVQSGPRIVCCVEYPVWWKDYSVVDIATRSKMSLLQFVIGNVLTNIQPGRMETKYLTTEDLGKIRPEALYGLKAEKKKPLPGASR